MVLSSSNRLRLLRPSGQAQQELDAPEKSKIKLALEDALLSILEQYNVKQISYYGFMDKFKQLRWGEKCPDIEHILSILDKAERKKYIDAHYRQKHSVSVDDASCLSEQVLPATHGVLLDQ